MAEIVMWYSDFESDDPWTLAAALITKGIQYNAKLDSSIISIFFI